ncbi:DUF1667 domain-containing protein [Lacrimispora brassicae]
MMKEFTCIICPNGCGISADIEIKEGGNCLVRSIDGALCPRGETYVRQELVDPRRNIATSVLVKGGILPLASVRLTKPIPKDRIFDAMEEIKKCSLTAPVTAGTVIVKHIFGYDADVIVTKAVPSGEFLK